MNFEPFWGGAPLLASTGRDQAIAHGAELEELGYQQGSDDESWIEDESDYENPQTGEVVRDRPKSRKSAKSRVLGGIAPIAKPITEDYDSDDARIIELKDQAYTNEAVARKLVEEGRIRYDGRSVANRYLRLKRLLDQKEDDRLDDELSDWHIGEDDELSGLHEIIEKKYEQQRQKLEDRKWKEISHALGIRLGKRKYSGKACRERFHGIAAGTNLLPIEMDPDQAGRRRMREKRVATAKQARQHQKDYARMAEKAKKAATEAKKKEAAEANQKRIQQALKKQAEKEEAERIKANREASKEKARKAKDAMLAQMNRERAWEKEKLRIENFLFEDKTKGASIDGKRVRSRKKKDHDESDEAEMSDLRGTDHEDELMIDDDGRVDRESDDYDGDVPEPAPKAPSENGKVRRSTRTSKKRQVTATPEARQTSARRTPTAKKRKSSVGGPAPVTKETLLNPRSILSVDELDNIIALRRLQRRAPDESHAQVVARLAAADEELTTKELDELLLYYGERKMKTKKPEKARKIQHIEARESDAGMMGILSNDLDFIKRYEGYHGEFSGLIHELEMEMGGYQVSGGSGY